MPDAKVMEILVQAQSDLADRFGVCSIFLFGSVARGDDRPGSDVDILVEFDRPASLFTLADLRLRLTELLGRPVDVGTPGGLRPRIRESVLQEAVRVA